MKHLSGVFSAALAEGNVTTSVAVLPIGKFDTAKYGELEITTEMASEIVANWAAKVLKTDIRFDIGHAMEEAAGWITGLSVGTFAHPVTGADMPGIIAAVEWTPSGKQILGDKQYRYVSSYLSSYKDEETGTVYANVLMAVALTNDPVMRLLPPVELADAPSGEGILLGEVVDEMTAEDRSQESHKALWEALDALSCILHREVEEDGLSGDALVARVSELAADLPNAVTVAVAEEDAEHGTPVAAPDTSLADSGSDPVAEMLARFDALMNDCDALVSGTAGVKAMRTLASETRKKMADLLSKKGGTTMAEEAKLADERDDALKQLAEMKRTQRNGKIDVALAALTAKGLTQPALDVLSTILKAETPESIVLSEGATPVEMPDALLKLAELVEFVPVAKTAEELTALANDKGAVTLSETEKATAKGMGVSEESMLAAKIAREAHIETDEED
jgi:Mu-like prophage I protein